jgi:hypothetical protein
MIYNPKPGDRLESLDILSMVVDLDRIEENIQKLILLLKLGCVLGSHGLGSHLVFLPTGNPPIGLGNRSQPNWEEGPI